MTDAAGKPFDPATARAAGVVELAVRLTNPNASLDFAPAVTVDTGDAKTRVSAAVGDSAFKPR